MTNFTAHAMYEVLNNDNDISEIDISSEIPTEGNSTQESDTQDHLLSH